jgi:hypothetical protein
MLTGRKIRGIFFSLFFLSAMCVFPDGNAKDTGSCLSISSQEAASLKDIKTKLSGIWYHTQTISTQKTIEQEFSWGVTSFDYWNALCIDLLGDSNTFQFADGGWSKISIDIDGNTPGVCYLHLSNSGSPAKEEVTIKFNNNGMSLLFTSGEGTGYADDIDGSFYKLAGPGTSNMTGVR